MEKKASLRVIPVKYPLGFKQMSGFSLLFLLSLGNLLHDADGSLWYMHVVLMTLFGGALIYLIVRRIALKAELALSDGRLIMNGISMTGASLQELRIDRGLIGLLPHGRRIVPVRLCVELQDRQASILLLRWAEKQGVRVRQGTFMRWL